MSSTTKTVVFGSQQEAVISPKEGHMVESVKVINTVNNEEVPSELLQIAEKPAQWACKFIQPAGNVVIKPKIVPILYTVMIEECDNCNILLVDSDESVSIEIKSVDEENSEAADKAAEASSNFNGPQHSFENGVEQALDVEDAESAASEVVTGAESEKVVSEDVTPEVSGENAEGKGIKTEDAEGEEQVSEPVADEVEANNEVDSDEDTQFENQETNNDTVYDAGEFEDELVEKEPITVTRAKYEEKCSIFLDYREAFARGDISEEEYKEVEKKHNQFFLDIDEGKIIVLD